MDLRLFLTVVGKLTSPSLELIGSKNWDSVVGFSVCLSVSKFKTY